MFTYHRTTVNLPSQLVRLAKMHALEQNKTFTEILEESLRQRLKVNENKNRMSLSKVLEHISPKKQISTSKREKLYQNHFQAKYG